MATTSEWQRSGHGRYTTAVDMYSLGVVLVEMITPLGYDATESERLTVIAEAKASNLREDAVSRFPKHAGLAKELMSIDPKLAILPGLAIALAVLGLNLLGDGLRDILDPRLRTEPVG